MRVEEESRKKNIKDALKDRKQTEVDGEYNEINLCAELKYLQYVCFRISKKKKKRLQQMIY